MVARHWRSARAVGGAGYRFGREETTEIPGYDLMVDDEELQVMVFPERGPRHSPLSPIDGKPMRRASRSAVLALLEPAGASNGAEGI